MSRRSSDGSRAQEEVAAEGLPERSVVISAEEFTERFKEYMELLGPNAEECARWFSGSKAVVKRWLAGKSAPAPGLRRLVLDRLQKQTEA